MHTRVLATCATLAVVPVVVAGCGGGSGPDPSASATSSTSSSTSSSITDLVGSWRANAAEILSANTANAGGTGSLACRGPIVMTFTDEGSFSRRGNVTCSVTGSPIERSGTISTTGRYATSGDQLTVSNVHLHPGSPIRDPFGDGTATYTISGSTLSITFTQSAVGTVTQVYHRVAS